MYKDMSLDQHLTPSQNLTKWIMEINVKYKISKLLQQNTGENICDLELGQESAIYKIKIFVNWT